jgi:hypothetical protein
MGLLNQRTRIVDVSMTPVGRAALASGGLTVAYASFTDAQTYYDPSSISGSSDTANARIFLEAQPSMPYDVLALTTDDSGKLIPATAFLGNGLTLTSNGDVFNASTSTEVIGNRAITRYRNTGSFSSAITSVTSIFNDSLNYNMILATQDPTEDDDQFSISIHSASFTITNSRPFNSASRSISVDDADGLFFDKRFANAAQFKFLPPVVTKNSVTASLGSFVNIKSFNQYTYQDLKDEVLGTDRNPIKERVDIEITKTSLPNDLVLQMFEINNNGILKLDAVDYGEVVDPMDADHPLKRVIFFGKVFIDSTETPTFINLFTMVID